MRRVAHNATYKRQHGSKNHRNLLQISSQNYIELILDMKQQSCFILGKKKKNNESKKYNYAIKYHITMASVEPAGMIPNLNCFWGKDKSQS